MRDVEIFQMALAMVKSIPVAAVARMIGQHDTRIWRVVHCPGTPKSMQLGNTQFYAPLLRMWSSLLKGAGTEGEAGARLQQAA